MNKYLLICLLAISFTACKNESREQEKEQKELAVHEEIAMANGFKEFDSIDQLNFTFNVKVNDSLRSSRRWEWNTETDEISLTERDTTLTYTRTDSIAEENKSIDQKFINDTYWLLFPFQLEWSNANFSEVKTAAAPISGKELKMITVSYPSEGGYTPGDSYDIYFDDDHMIQEWVYKAAGGNRQMATTWEDYQNYKGVKIAKSHKSADGSFELYFSDISVE
ncbi:hypothetical protein MKO06_16060 [Gramella sp. GC03-9]|uniref:Uncharacterized protein n=1 Tax=Christiangramia oceanisediminis TaxID=2920386 RepID=A0A9X2L068_9FLAO|nr:hypothetical protein [Gramella oceanisediminis]MCP9201426.1 hypothetical protein [Gramella oceanisediminis]